MKLSLLKGSFSKKEIETLVTELVQVKIKFHEDKIRNSDEEETIKMRENRIIKLQNELKELRSFLNNSDSYVNVDADIFLTRPHDEVI
jgi:hypothetical protein